MLDCIACLYSACLHSLLARIGNEFCQLLPTCVVQDESRKHFADDRVLIERYVQRPRHVEVQVRRLDSPGRLVGLIGC